MDRKRVIILGAAGRDFHNFNVLFRGKAEYEVVAFTANQIPYISGKDYPPVLSGKLYPKGIHIYDESELPSLIKRLKADLCIMSYSDQPNGEVMQKSSLVNSLGADFWLVSPEHTYIKSSKPVIAVCAVRTGCGKSQTSRYILSLLKKKGIRAVAVRHPMPYGDLREQVVERFSTLKDLDRYKTTVEEREDYEPHIRRGFVVYAGVDYEKILRRAEKEADVVLWDGGNNDASFFKPDLLITVADPLRAGDELTYYPGETVARMADVLLINKVNSATKAELGRIMKDLKAINPDARVIKANSEVFVENGDAVRGKRALVIEDGPTITHGGMMFGAGTVAAKKYHVGSVVDAKKYAVGEIRKTYERYKRLGRELPAVGYSKKEKKDLETTINRARCDVVLSATPTDLNNIVNVNKQIVQVGYELDPIGGGLDSVINKFIRENVK